MSRYKKGDQLFPGRYLQRKRVDTVYALLIIKMGILVSRQ
jgi:hypothetical protein